MSLSAVEARVVSLIAARQGDLLRDLESLVALPTGGNNTPALDETRNILCRRLERLGATTTLVPGAPRPSWLFGEKPGNVIPPTAICRRLAGRARKVLLSGHIDTVHDPKGAFQRLDIRPDNKTATGPGCVDMKGGLVIAIAALEALTEAGIEIPWLFVLNSDEETGSYHSEVALRAAAKEADVGLVFEPALPDGSLVIERQGSGQFYIETSGRSAHVGRDFANGVSAVTALAERLVSAARCADPARGRIVNIGPIEGGHATNVVPDRARAWGNVRFTTPDVARELERDVKSLATASDAVPGARIETSFNRPAKPATPPVMALAESARAAAEDLGQKLPFGKTGGVCDGNILQDAGLPVIDTLGVRGGGLHTLDEWIELASLVERCQLAAITIMRASQA